MSRGMEYKDDVMKIGKLYDIDEGPQAGRRDGLRRRHALTKVYVLAEHPDPKQQHYLSLYKMGEGPLYSFFHPYHLVHFEVPNAIARVVLFRDSVAKPLGGPVVEVCAVAKRDLKAGEVLDDYGMYMTYGEAVNADEMCDKRYLPEGLVEGCVLTRDVSKDAVITYERRHASPEPFGRSAARRTVPPLPRRDLAGRTGCGARLTRAQVTMSEAGDSYESRSILRRARACGSAMRKIFPSPWCISASGPCCGT